MSKNSVSLAGLSFSKFGAGVEVAEDGDFVIIRYNRKSDFGDSSTGKSRTVCSTQGNITLSDGHRLGVNAFRKK